MARVIFKDKKSLQSAKRRTRGTIGFRQMRDSRVIVAKWPKKRRKGIN